MIIESLLIVAFALGLDFAVGDPKNRFHPTAWIGKLIGRIIPSGKTNSSLTEKISGTIFVIFVTGIVSLILYTIDFGINLISVDIVSLIVSVIVGSILLKTTIAIRGMENHAMKVVNCIENNDDHKIQYFFRILTSSGRPDPDPELCSMRSFKVPG